VHTYLTTERHHRPAHSRSNSKPGGFVRIPIIPFFLLVLPLLEIAGFVLVGRQIGVLATLGLIVATGIAGAMLLRFQGFGVMARIRREMEAGRDPSRELAHGIMILIAGFLLLIPGFLTDILGILLFVPIVRDLGWRFLKSRVDFATDFSVMRGGGFRRGRTIDLDRDDYSKGGPSETPWRRIDED
jgi:UPF0716 protein FxsA